MGYSTDFYGQFDITPALDDDTYTLLVGLSSTRRMKRQGLDPKYGVDGEFYFNPNYDDYGQERDESIVDYNNPPSTQPGLWCQWAPTDDRTTLVWDEGEKFYDYTEWLTYIVDRILAPKGYVVDGEVTWQGEDRDDNGKITVVQNAIYVSEGQIVYGTPTHVNRDKKGA